MASHLTTFTVAMGDARYYVRKLFQDLVYPVGHEAAGELDSTSMKIEEDAMRSAIADLTNGKVIGVQRGTYYDASNIPNGTSANDKQIVLLIKFGTAVDAPVRQITIPQAIEDADVPGWFELNKAGILDSDGTAASELIGFNYKTMKRARGSN